MKPSAWWTLCWPSAVTGWPLTTSMPAVADGGPDPVDQRALWDPGRGRDVELADLPGLAEHLGGHRRGERSDGGAERAVRAAPGGDAGDRVRRRALALVRTRTCVADAECPTSAECLSITTWPAAARRCPPGSQPQRVEAASPVQAMPIVAARRRSPIGLPSASTIWA